MAYRSLAFLVALFLFVDCSHVGNVGGYPNTAWLIRSYYENNAQERGASCNSPSIQTLNAATIIEDTPQKVVMRVKYFWIDRSRIDNNDPLSGGFVLGVPGGAGYCQGWNTRDFTFDKMTDGTLTIAGNLTIPVSGMSPTPPALRSIPPNRDAELHSSQGPNYD